MPGIGSVPVPMLTVPPPAPGGRELRGMEGYFAAMDQWWSEHGPLDGDVSAAVRAFEASEACPIYADFTRFTFEERADAARKRVHV